MGAGPVRPQARRQDSCHSGCVFTSDLLHLLRTGLHARERDYTIPAPAPPQVWGALSFCLWMAAWPWGQDTPSQRSSWLVSPLSPGATCCGGGGVVGSCLGSEV